MDTLRWVAASYSNELPVYVPDSGRLLKGDRVRITSGPFTDMEAEVVVQPGGGHKDVMVRILDCLWVPLVRGESWGVRVDRAEHGGQARVYPFGQRPSVGGLARGLGPLPRLWRGSG